MRGRLLLLIGVLGVAASTEAAVVVREQLAPNVYAAIKGGRVIFLECRPPSGDAAEEFLTAYLAEPGGWKAYRNRMAVAIPYGKLNQATRHRLLEALFPQDYADEQGWWHTVTYQGANGLETWWVIAEWLTGIGTNYRQIQDHPANRGLDEELRKGQRILVPRALLLKAMRKPSPRPGPMEEGETLPNTEGELEYGRDNAGAYALYRLKRGEALYTSVVAKFTDYREHDAVITACQTIQKRSGIEDVRRMAAGQEIRIPLEMLADQYLPMGSERRQHYEAVREEARRLRAQRVSAKGLDGVVVILDPGHGGRDHGAAVSKRGLYEDELNYDMVCRIKRKLEQETQAKVYVTLRDKSQDYGPTNRSRFTHDRDEELLTTPPYDNYDARTSANLRWYLANAILRRELKAGREARHVLFASIHCDALFDGRLRGAMVYVPGAAYRRDSEQPSGAVYARYSEALEMRRVSSTSAERRRDEALSRNFATTFLKSMAENTPPLKVHDAGPPIRNVIRRSGGRAFVPAVLRNTLVPTKVLIEAANMTNRTDQRRLADPEWREWFAGAFVNAVKQHFAS